MTEETKVEQPTENAPQQEGADLTISDLSAMRTIIDIASSRGAFKPNEMVAVGQTYNKLSAFLDQVAKQPKQGA
jgi:cell division protein FtsL